MDEAVVAPVVIDGTILFQVRGIAAYPADRRAKGIADRIVALAADPAVASASLRTEDSQPGATAITAGNRPVLTVFDVDAQPEGVER